MLDKITEKSPAKINLFLKIINRRDDGFHNIRSGITFIDLFDKITVQPHSKFEVIYTGKFAPKNNLFEDCIIDKLFTYIHEDKPKLLFTISKNFPFGLRVLIILEYLKYKFCQYISKSENFFLSRLTLSVFDLEYKSRSIFFLI